MSTDWLTDCVNCWMTVDCGSWLLTLLIMFTMLNDWLLTVDCIDYADCVEWLWWLLTVLSVLSVLTVGWVNGWLTVEWLNWWLTHCREWLCWLLNDFNFFDCVDYAGSVKRLLSNCCLCCIDCWLCHLCWLCWLCCCAGWLLTILTVDFADCFKWLLGWKCWPCCFWCLYWLLSMLFLKSLCSPFLGMLPFFLFLEKFFVR